MLNQGISEARPLFTALLRTFLRTLFAWQRRRGHTLGIRDGQTGAVSFLQRFGGALDLYLPVHSLVPDGLFVPADDGLLTFVPLPPPTDEDVAASQLDSPRHAAPGARAAHPGGSPVGP